LTQNQALARTAILSLLDERGPGLTICPSEAARRLAGADWRGAMAVVHATAADLAAEGRIRLSQRGAVVSAPVGAYRIARP
jgi:hypothetical protein